MSLAQQCLDPSENRQVPDQDTGTHLAKEDHRLRKRRFGCLIVMVEHGQNAANLEEKRPGFGAGQGGNSRFCLGEPLLSFREVSHASRACCLPGVQVAQLVRLLATVDQFYPAQEALLHLVKPATPEVGHSQAGAALLRFRRIIGGNRKLEGAFKQRNAFGEFIAAHQQVSHNPVSHRFETAFPKLASQFERRRP